MFTVRSARGKQAPDWRLKTGVREFSATFTGPPGPDQISEMPASEETSQPPAIRPEENNREEGEDEVVSEEIKLLRRKRGQKLAAFSRICHRADAIIVGRGSRTRLEGMLEAIDTALEGVIAANDSLEACLHLPKDKMDADAYSAKVEGEREAVLQRITQYLAERKDEAPSEVGSRVSTAQKSRASSVSRASQVEAEVSAKMKALRLQQVRRRQEQERAEEEERQRQEEERRRQEEKTQRQEREVRRRQQLQEAEDEAEAAQLEAQLRKNLGDDLAYERRNDFEGELIEPDEAVAGNRVRGLREAGKQSFEAARDRNVPDVRKETSEATSNVESRPVRLEEPTLNQVRDTAAWIRELRSPQHVPQAERGPACSAFAKSIPRLSLPTFSGKASEWPRWIGLFKALVHDQPSLSDTEKIAHLQASVSGLAQQTISGMLYDGSLYHQALETLEERFGQDDDIIKFNLNSIFNAPDPLEDDANP